MAKRKENERATNYRNQVVMLDAEIDRVIGRVIRWTNKLASLRDIKKRRVRELAKALTE